MTEYSIGFAKEMSKASSFIVKTGVGTEDSQRAAVYMALVACEIAIKSALEKAGIPVSVIKANKHNLSKLLEDLGGCKVREEVANGIYKNVPATRIRALVVDQNYNDATVGNLLQAEKLGASKFPNEIRYGDTLKHFPASVITILSEKVIAWVEQHFDDIQK